MSDQFDDLMEANRSYADGFTLAGIPATAARGLAVVTCMDSRIEPLAMLGLAPGDAKILRTAGARVTDDVLRNLVLAVNLLGVDRIAIVPHTDCKMTSASDDEIRAELAARHPDADVSGFEPLAVEDQQAVLRADVERVASSPFVPPDVTVAGFRYDVATGALERIV